MNLTDFRSEFPITRSRAYLFAGAHSPAARSVSAALEEWVRAWVYDPLDSYDRVLANLEQVRASFAHLIGSTAAEVAVTDNTSRGSNQAVRLLARRSGHILVDDSTYPSSIYPWITLQGREIKYVPTDTESDPTEALARGIEPGTAAVIVSHVAPLTGRRHDLARLSDKAHAMGALLIVDAAQSTGVLPINVRSQGIDILVSTAMKWLLGPPGIAFLYADSRLIEDAPLGEVGYMGLKVQDEIWPRTHVPPALPDARRLELGFPSLPALPATEAGIELIEAVGLETISKRIAALTQHCIEELLSRGLRVHTPSDPDRRAGVVAAHYRRAHELAEFLRLRGVDVGGYPWGLLRVDPHAYCSNDDIQRFLDGLDVFDRLYPE